MSDQQDSDQIAHLKQVNARLNRSLERCRALVDDCRSKLAANSNEPIFFRAGGDGSDENDRA